MLWKYGCIVYVGQSENIIQRVGVHLANPSKDFDGWSYATVENGDLNEIETELIIRYKPILNKTLPANKQYVTARYLRNLGFNGWKIRRILKKIQPIWKDYYSVKDFEGVV